MLSVSATEVHHLSQLSRSSVARQQSLVEGNVQYAMLGANWPSSVSTIVAWDNTQDVLRRLGISPSDACLVESQRLGLR